LHVTTTAWIITIVVTIGVLAFDLIVIGRRPHEPSMKECSIAISIYVGLAILFGLGVWYTSGPRYAGEFYAGWLTEYSLSIDNLFIFVIIMSNMRVPRKYQQYALMVGIVLALIFRAIFIFLGAAAIAQFAWIFFIFGGFLIWTAWKLFMDWLHPKDDEEITENAVMRWVKKRFPSTEEYHGTKLSVVESGKRLLTPMFFVIVALGSTDLLFALDSIPAIYGLTQEAYLVFAANVFALMGLRQLYFLIGGLLQRLVYLSVGLSIILAFIGVKLLLHAIHEYGLDQKWWGISVEIPIWLSLLVIIGTLAVTTVASLIKSRRDEQRESEASA
jgi:tellurite resistance protein TerC